MEDVQRQPDLYKFVQNHNIHLHYLLYNILCNKHGYHPISDLSGTLYIFCDHILVDPIVYLHNINYLYMGDNHHHNDHLHLRKACKFH